MYTLTSRSERIAHRYKISLGHLKKVVDMLEKGEYCMNILLQSQAVQNALKETDRVLLKHHLETCASNAIKQGKGKQAVEEIMRVFRRAQ